MFILVVMTSMSVAKQLRILLRATFQFSKELIVSLCAHNDLTVDIFNIHVFSSVASMCSHEGGLIRHTVDVICNSSMCCLLEGRSSITTNVISSCLLDGIERTTVAGKGRLLLRVVLRLLQADYIIFLWIVTLTQFGV